MIEHHQHQASAQQHAHGGADFGTARDDLAIAPIEQDRAEQAAVLASKLASGDTLTGDTTVDGIQATLLTPVVVTVDNIKDTVVKDGFYTIDQICTPDYAAACKTAGLE